MERAKTYYEAGYRVLVDIDMKQYFDTVHHDKLMYHVEEHIGDACFCCHEFEKTGSLEMENFRFS